MRSRSLASRKRADDLAQVDRHRLAPRDGEDRLLLDLALQRVDLGVGRGDALRQRAVALGQRVDRIGDLLLGQAAHLGDHAGEILQVGVEGLGRCASVIWVVLQSPAFDCAIFALSRSGR